MAFTQVEESRLRALMNQDTSLLTLATNEPAIIQELGAQDVTIDELQLAGSLLQTDKLPGRFGGEDKAIVLSVLSQFLKGGQGLGLGSAAYKNEGVGLSDIPGMSNFSFSSSSPGNGFFNTPGALIQTGVSSSDSTGNAKVTFQIPFARNYVIFGFHSGTGGAFVYEIYTAHDLLGATLAIRTTAGIPPSAGAAVNWVAIQVKL